MQGMWKLIGIWVASFAVAAGGLAEQSHPRLWFPKASEEGLRNKLSRDPLAAKLQAAVMSEAGRILKARTCRYEIPDGKRLLAESRLALHNIMHTAWAWRLGGGEMYRLRAIAELRAACGLKDWNPSHFLDTAEMATAVATGYDWLYDSLTPEQRAMCEQAILEKSLKPAKAIYDKGTAWSKPGNNWSQVCGSGIALAAAAIAGKDDGLSEDLFDRGLRLVEGCEKFYQPDGMYPEGPGYWHYGTNYHVMLLAACQSLDRPIADATILSKSGDAIMQLSSPAQLTFNFSDGGAGLDTPSPAQFWLAAHFNHPTQTAYTRDLATRLLERKRTVPDRWSPLSVLWLPEATKLPESLPTAAVFMGSQPIAIFRTRWDSNASWFAIKGGTPAASHGHMDVGSFVYDAHGVRWIHDLGKEDYNLPGYFGAQRWSYFRLQSRSHNTLEIGGKLQNDRSIPCLMIDSDLTGDRPSASFDLTPAYTGSAGKVLRSATFDRLSGAVRIDDEITKPSGEVIWRAFTDAKAEISGDQVILKKSGDQISLRRVGPVGTWSVLEAKPPTAEENPNHGFRAVVLTIPAADHVSVGVEIRP